MYDISPINLIFKNSPAVINAILELLNSLKLQVSMMCIHGNMYNGIGWQIGLNLLYAE